MMITNFEMVGDFHKKFDLPRCGDQRGTHTHIDDDVFLFRFQFMLEELTEIMSAHRAKDMAKIADGIADLLYVTYGLAHMYGLPIDIVFEEVQRANMAKERASSKGDDRSHRKHAMDVVKPEGWQPPDIDRVLGIKR